MWKWSVVILPTLENLHLFLGTKAMGKNVKNLMFWVQNQSQNHLTDCGWEELSTGGAQLLLSA